MLTFFFLLIGTFSFSLLKLYVQNQDLIIDTETTKYGFHMDSFIPKQPTQIASSNTPGNPENLELTNKTEKWPEI